MQQRFIIWDIIFKQQVSFGVDKKRMRKTNIRHVSFQFFLILGTDKDQDGNFPGSCKIFPFFIPSRELIDTGNTLPVYVNDYFSPIIAESVVRYVPPVTANPSCRQNQLRSYPFGYKFPDPAFRSLSSAGNTTQNSKAGYRAPYSFHISKRSIRHLDPLKTYSLFPATHIVRYTSSGKTHTHSGRTLPDETSSTAILLRKNSPSIRELHNRYIFPFSGSKHAQLINVVYEEAPWGRDCT